MCRLLLSKKKQPSQTQFHEDEGPLMVLKILLGLKHYPPRLELQLPVRIIVL